MLIHLIQKLQKLQASFHYVPPFSSYKYRDQAKLNEINENPAKKLNASLAIQLAYDWIKKNPNKVANNLNHFYNEDGSVELSDEIVAGLTNCFWPGRCQTLQMNNKKYD